MTQTTLSAERAITLNDKYTLDRGRVYLTGTQALIRLMLVQRRRDRAAGLDTAGFVSGYRGSPLGGLDRALWAAQPQLVEHRIHFQPGLNEDLAATSVWGTQQLHLFPNPQADGVFSLWYGKGPGVDRSIDVLKHGNMAGSAQAGGVLLVAGDDHGCQSSTLPHQSEQVFAAALIPVLHPASVQEYLDFGLFGFALSRYSGCWVGFKAIAETVESSASVAVDAERLRFVTPEWELPPGGLNIRWPDPPMVMEQRLLGPKLAAVAAFARANPIDRVVIGSEADRLGIACAGKAYLDVRQALEELGLDAARCQALGLRVYKIGLAWPLATDGALAFARGLAEVLVVEEKRAFIEDQLAKALYALPAAQRPRLSGKTDERGAPLLPSAGELGPALVARAIVARLSALGELPSELSLRLQRLLDLEALARETKSAMARTPFFCSGCPHNRSTTLPEGSMALAGIGCHGMAQLMPQRNTITSTHMGGEGATWIGMAPFNGGGHVFQNLGDGTYQHSGLLAIRAAAAAGVNITYKILHNGAVAMTGGQPLEGAPTVPQITRQVAAEGARRVVVVADDPSRWQGNPDLAPGVSVRHRDELDAVQRELRETPGLSVLVYDQACAAEARRQRKRSKLKPAARVIINPAVCEGCGDCSVASNCVSVRPLTTELGDKREIDQSACNQDLSCLRGFCPSFVTVPGAVPRRAGLPTGSHAAAREVEPDPAQGLPLPTPAALDAPYGILVTGVGGTGVLTIGALLGMAAHLEGRAVTTLDFTGLAQKNGAVMSHVRIARSAEDLHAVRLAPGGADLLLACDLVTASSEAALSRLARGRTRAVLNTDVAPTAAFLIQGSAVSDEPLLKALQTACDPGDLHPMAASRLATALAGDAITTNLLMLGFAYQRGLLPLSLAAIDRAIELNGVALEQSRRVFAWGRVAAHDPQRLAALAPLAAERPAAAPFKLDDFIERRVRDLVAYQDPAYAERYRVRVARVAEAEAKQAPGCSGLAEAAARSLFKLMAYKDEYEVARLYRAPEFRAQLASLFEGNPETMAIEFHLAPSWLVGSPRHPDAEGSRPAKRRFGRWIWHGFGLLAALKRLRGTPWDPFGRSEDRRLERALRDQLEHLLDEITRTLSPANHALALELVRLPDRIRGYGPVKRANAATVQRAAAELLARYRAGGSPARRTIPVFAWQPDTALDRAALHHEPHEHGQK
jgi:indolepyruvate ferredoxin oxidoreductase